MFGIQHDANAGRHWKSFIAGIAFLAEHGQQPVGILRRPPAADLAGQRHDEFVAADSGAEGALVEGFPNMATGRTDQGIADRVAESIIDHLEFVQIQIKQYARFPMLPGLRQFLLQPGIQAGPVGHPGQTVEIGQLTNFSLDFHTFQKHRGQMGILLEYLHIFRRQGMNFIQPMHGQHSPNVVAELQRRHGNGRETLQPRVGHPPGILPVIRYLDIAVLPEYLADHAGIRRLRFHLVEGNRALRIPSVDHASVLIKKTDVTGRRADQLQGILQDHCQRIVAFPGWLGQQPGRRPILLFPKQQLRFFIQPQTNLVTQELVGRLQFLVHRGQLLVHCGHFFIQGSQFLIRRGQVGGPLVHQGFQPSPVQSQFIFHILALRDIHAHSGQKDLIAHPQRCRCEEIDGTPAITRADP